MSKTFWAVIAVIVVIFGGIVVFNKHDNAASTTNAQPTNHTITGTTGVTLVEYGDFQCPFCGQYYPIVEQVKEKYNGKITFQFRNLPLVQAHRNALAAARAAEAADKQGKYWDMYGTLFQNQKAWSELNDASPSFIEYATQLGLDMTKFKADVADPKTNDVINADIAEFKKTKNELSTPTFFLDGKKVQPKSLDEFSKLIDDAIAAKQQN